MSNDQIEIAAVPACDDSDERRSTDNEIVDLVRVREAEAMPSVDGPWHSKDVFSEADLLIIIEHLLNHSASVTDERS